MNKFRLKEGRGEGDAVLGWLGMKTTQSTEVSAPATYPVTLDNESNFFNITGKGRDGTRSLPGLLPPQNV